MLRFELNSLGKKINLQKTFKKLEIVLSKKLNINGKISLVFLKDSEIKKLNKTYRGKNKSTDILTFVLNDEYLGEIILGYDKIKERARKMKGSFDDVVAYLLIHGVLHILGYSHQMLLKASKMESKEDELLGKLGLKLTAGRSHLSK